MIWENTESGDGLVPHGTRPSPDLMITGYVWRETEASIIWLEKATEGEYSVRERVPPCQTPVPYEFWYLHVYVGVLRLDVLGKSSIYSVF